MARATKPGCEAGNTSEPASNRRSVLKTIAGATAVVGGVGATIPTVGAHHDEEPDYEYGVKSEDCSYNSDTTIHSGLKIETWYRGIDDDRHKHEWVTAIGSSAIAERNGDAYPNIKIAGLQMAWDEDQHDYRPIEVEPKGYSPETYAYQKTSDPDRPCEACDHILLAGAGLLAGYLGGTVGSVLWTGSTLTGNLLAEFADTQATDQYFHAHFDYADWANRISVVQGHYNWIYHVYLDYEDRFTIDVTDVIDGLETDVYTSVTLSYYTDSFHYEVRDYVTHTTNHSDSC